MAHEAIEVIEPDQFGELDDYETSFLTYYADGKLVFDTEDQPVDDDDIPKIIGNEHWRVRTEHCSCPQPQLPQGLRDSPGSGELARQPRR